MSDMIEVSLFINENHHSRMSRKIPPGVGDTIILDCGSAVRVVEVVHQWNGDDIELVQVNCEEVKPIE